MFFKVSLRIDPKTENKDLEGVSKKRGNEYFRRVVLPRIWSLRICDFSRLSSGGGGKMVSAKWRLLQAGPHERVGWAEWAPGRTMSYCQIS